jgi:quercetin dioxygenase-like cupin family protein
MSSEGSFDELPVEEPYPGLRRRTFDSREATVNEYTFRPEAAFPRHRHPQEQITLVLEGSVELTVGGRSIGLREGSWSVIGGSVEHSIRAGADGAKIVAIVIPRRETPDAYTVLE